MTYDLHRRFNRQNRERKKSAKNNQFHTYITYLYKVQFNNGFGARAPILQILDGLMHRTEILERGTHNTNDRVIY